MQIYNDELIHYGVLGMRWGHRKPKDFTSYVESKNKIIINKDGSKTIPKNFKFNRVGNNSLDINESGALYASYGKSDAARYIKQLGPSTIGKLLGTASYNVQHLSVTSDLKMPSNEQIAQKTAEILGKNKKLLKEFNDSIYSLSVTKDFDKTISNDDLKNMIKNPSSKESQSLAYGVNSIFGDPNYKKETMQFYDEYRKAGYDAIPDLHDIYNGTSETATIIINPKKVKVESYTYITKDIYKSGKSFVKSIGKLKPSDLID